MATDIETIELTTAELAELRWAWQRLEHPSLAARLSNAIGMPVEIGIKLLPHQWSARIQHLVNNNIRRALELTRFFHLEVEYWPILDPTGLGENREAKLVQFRAARDQISQRLIERFGQPTLQDAP